MGLPAVASKLEHCEKDPKSWALEWLFRMLCRNKEKWPQLLPLIQISLQSLRRDFLGTPNELTGRHRRKRTFQSETARVGNIQLARELVVNIALILMGMHGEHKCSYI